LISAQPGVANVNAQGIDALASDETVTFAQAETAGVTIAALDAGVALVSTPPAAGASAGAGVARTTVSTPVGLGAAGVAAGNAAPLVSGHPGAGTADTTVPATSNIIATSARPAAVSAAADARADVHVAAGGASTTTQAFDPAPVVTPRVSTAGAANTAPAVSSTGQSVAHAGAATTQVVAPAFAPSVQSRVPTTHIAAVSPLSGPAVAAQVQLAGVLAEALRVIGKATFTWPPVATSVSLLTVAAAVVDIATVAMATVVLEDAADAEVDVESVARGYAELVPAATGELALQ
jgi:hypothetical protein